MKFIKTALYATAILSTFAAGSASADSLDAQSQVLNYSEQASEFDVLTQKVGKDIQQIDVAIWSEEGGQDDIRWYSASTDTDQASIHFSLANHGNRAGTYRIHAYTSYKDGSRSGSDLGSYRILPTAPQINLDLNTVSLQSERLAATGSKIVTAVWSDQDGQDDLRWYELNDTGRAQFDVTNHKGYGVYQAHSYLSQDGKMIPIGNQSFEVARPQLTPRFEKLSDTRYDVYIDNVPSHISSLKIPIWSDTNDQDDIQWYQAQKVAPNTYKVSLNLKAHAFTLGSYQAHIYGESSLAQGLEGYGAGLLTVDTISHFDEPERRITDKSSEGFRVSVSETDASKMIQSVSLAVWSEADNSNLKWYQINQATEGQFTAKVNVKDHGNKSGLYQVHVYVTFKDGSVSGYVLDSQELTASSQVAASPVITSYISETNSYPVGQCTWGVKALAPWIPNSLGNAKHWAANASRLGFRIGNQPQVGSIAVWPRDGGGYGHVGYVVAVDNSHRIQIKEANYKGNQYISNFRSWFDPLESMWGGEVVYIYPN
ncbi:GBS Bsp-like repeat-containing protein [Streptococcus loxodontisalivarius]|uniref:Surface antigen n=1 Tax=Streptococcus loxodontisalivarius TaxID=1349415 RepID=A0ABS2PQW8_9STRE|nr:GBS Bsp-like repeat-containing protein [Streptococcus loxodontisalivarius]MBM7642432.1 surface antigen [Streptococcus loxodontisalivarius]